MTTQKIAQRLVELCRQGQFEAAQKELYADDCISTEPAGAPMETVEGLDALIEKGERFMSMVEEVHGIEVSDPLVAGSYFTVVMKLDTTMKDSGRSLMEEICLYQVHEGKIVSEEFFYDLA